MTREHFEKIAASIKAEKECYTNTIIIGAMRRMAETLADTFRGVNPRFDRERFLTACGF